MIAHITFSALWATKKSYVDNYGPVVAVYVIPPVYVPVFWVVGTSRSYKTYDTEYPDVADVRVMIFAAEDGMPAKRAFAEVSSVPHHAEQ